MSETSLPRLHVAVAPLGVNNAKGRQRHEEVQKIVEEDIKAKKATGLVPEAVIIKDWDTLTNLHFNDANSGPDFSVPWLIVIDYHADFEEVCDFFSKDLKETLADRKDLESWNAAIAFLDVKRHDEKGNRNRQLNDFFLRMVQGYGWGTVSQRKRFGSGIVRLLNHPRLFRLTMPELRAWREDVGRLWKVVERKKRLRHWLGSLHKSPDSSDQQSPGGTALEEGHDSPSEPPVPELADPFKKIKEAEFLRDLALFHQLGRRRENAAEKELGALEWMKKEPGLYHLEKRRSEYLRRCAELERRKQTWTTRVKNARTPQETQEAHRQVARLNVILTVYAHKRNIIYSKMEMFHIYRDLGKCLMHATAPWAADSKRGPDGSTPIKVLAVKDYVRDDHRREALSSDFALAFAAAFRSREVQGVVEGDVQLDCVDLAPFQLECPRVHDAGELRTQGKALVLAAQVNNSVHIRIFDRAAVQVANASESDFPANMVTVVRELKDILEALGPKGPPSEDVKADVLKLVASLSGYDFLEDSRWDKMDWWRERTIGRKQIVVRRHAPLVKEILESDKVFDLEDSPPTEGEHSLWDYDIILVEAEHKTRFIGPAIVQWLDIALDEIEKGRETKDNGRKRERPHLFVLSRNEHAGHSYICLNHGAEAFAPKSRVYGIPALLTFAQVGKRSVKKEPQNSRPNFRVLYGVVPRIANRLRSEQLHEKIVGDEWNRPWVRRLPKADLHFHMGTSISLRTVAALAANTAGYALYSHVDKADKPNEPMATLVSDVCKTVLLANIVWNLPESPGRKRLLAAEAIWAAARFIRLPREKGGKVVKPRIPDLEVYDQVVSWLTRPDRPIKSFETCGLLVTAITVFHFALKRLREDRDANEGQQRKGLFKVFQELQEKQAVNLLEDALLRPWSYLPTLGEVWTGHDNTAKTQLAIELERMLDYHLRRVSRNWSHAQTKKAVAHDESPDGRLRSWLELLFKRVGANVRTAVRCILDSFIQLLNQPEWLELELEEFVEADGAFYIGREIVEKFKAEFRFTSATTFPLDKNAAGGRFQALNLKQCVSVPMPLDHPAEVEPKHRTLARYLRGAGLLGAEHLQFPENLLLAGFDVVRQNVKDNVIYAEPRCATTGYCQAGMNPHDATDLLCLSFDLAAFFFGAFPPNRRRQAAGAISDRIKPAVNSEAVAEETELKKKQAEYRHLCWRREVKGKQLWTRTNLILGAKRHKDLNQLRDVVALVRTYLERGVERPLRCQDPMHSFDLPGSWWARCRVVGFDLSGDEANKDVSVDDLRRSMAELFVVSAPITIHAGEAATASSIWDAVYLLGAQRIGHGLRLREQHKLLAYCVGRGICMELCPISNVSTNLFIEPDQRRPNDEPDENAREMENAREIYPLRVFMNEGMDVCLNTDNRFLHSRSTLTDEYLVAARLSGGLSRWDVLKIAKGGFKNAFLPKDEIAALLRHVEYDVYRLTDDSTVTHDFPIPGHVWVNPT